jgi:hypothetical protein
MSVSSTIARVVYTVGSTFPQTLTVTFPFATSGDIAVSDGAALCVLGSDYTVSGGGYNAANQLQTGSITLLGSGSSGSGTTAIQPGDIVVIYRNQSPVQSTTFASTGLLTPLMIEQDDDRLTTFDQQLLLNYFNPFPTSATSVSTTLGSQLVSGTPNTIFLGWITAQTGGIRTSIDSLNVVSILTTQLPLVIAVSISDDYELWKLRPMVTGDPSSSLGGAFIVPVTNPNSLIWVRVG